MNTKPHRTCILHTDQKTLYEEIKSFDSKTWDRVVSIDNYRKSHGGTSKYLATKLPSSYDDTIGYHSMCYKNFTAISMPPLGPDVRPKERCLRTNIVAQTSSSGIFRPVCLFCHKVTKSQGRLKKEQLGNCETAQAGTSIRDAAATLGDHDMLAQIAGVDFIAKEIKYHHSCRKAYLNKAGTEHTQSTPDPNSSFVLHQNAFETLKVHIVDNLIEAEGAELLTSLHATYLKILGDDYSTYPASSLRDKILQEFPEQLSQCKRSNKKGIIIYNASLSEDTATKRALFDSHSIIESAWYLRRLVKDIERQSEELPDKLTADILSKGQGDPPEDLVTFFTVLYTGSVKGTPSDKVSRLVHSVCADVMYNSTRGRLKPGKHLNMGLGIKSMTGSRKVVEVLNHLGHSISYHTAEELETRLAYEIADKKLATPDGLLMQAGLGTALAWDNYDENTETLSGAGTVHDTVGICFQNVPPAAVLQEDETSIASSSNRNSQQQKVKKHTPRAFTKEQKTLEPYRKKPKMSRFNYPERRIERPLNLTKVEWRDILWMISIALEPTPMWTGWNAQASEDPLPIHKIAYMDNISLPPTRLDVVVETMKISQKVAEECGEPYALVTYDLAIAKPAMQIQDHDAPLFDNVFISFGAFHITLAYFGCIGYFLDGSGGANILTETGVLAPGSLNGFLLGKHYNRCKRLHPLLATAIQSLHFSSFLETHGPMPASILEQLHESPSAMLAALEGSDDYDRFMTEYDKYTEQTLDGKHGSTAKYWMLYVNLVRRFFLFNRACRTNDLPLFIYGLEMFIPIFFAGNRPNYSRWMVRYQLNLINAKYTHPGVTELLEDGALSVRRTKKSFSRTAVDMTLEQTVNADAASRQTGISAFIHSETARRRWMVTRAIRSAIVGNLLFQAGMNAPEDVTNDLRPNRIKKDNEDLSKLIQGIKSTMNPFAQQADDNLYCLTSGKKLPDQIKEDVLSFITQGEAWATEFKEACFEDPLRFEKPIKRRKVQNFASASVNTKVPAKQKVQEVQGTRDLFGRLLVIGTTEKIDLEKVLEFPLTPVPLSLAHTDGSINKTDKSRLMHKLEGLQIDHAIPDVVDVVIVDATFLLHTQQNLPTTFGEISRVLLFQLCRMADEVHFVCDTYTVPSIKDTERERRGTQDVIFSITGPNQHRPKDWQLALKSSFFKVALFRFLATEWMKDSYTDLITGHQVYLALDNDCFCFTSTAVTVMKQTVQDLASHHEEADTRMVYHLHHIIEHQTVENISIRSNDTDVLVILLYYMSQSKTTSRIWLDAGLSSNNTRRHVSINDLRDTVGIKFAEALPGLHAFTGCDYTASFLNKGKARPMDLVLKNDHYKDLFATLGNSQTMSDSTVSACESFVCHLYGKINTTKVNTARHVIFQQTYAPRTLDNPLNAIKGINPSSMPPCSKVLLNKLKRSNYVASLWKKAASQNPCQSTPAGNGWVLVDNTYTIDWYDGDQLPKDIYKALEIDTQNSLDEEMEDEEVAHGESLYGPDESDGDDEDVAF